MAFKYHVLGKLRFGSWSFTSSKLQICFHLIRATDLLGIWIKRNKVVFGGLAENQVLYICYLHLSKNVFKYHTVSQNNKTVFYTCH